MKKLLLAAACGLFAFASSAKDGYKIEVKFKQDVTDSFVYLAHYYAKPLPTIYKTDSARVINRRTAVIESRDSILGGIYMILFDGRSKFAEFMLNNGDAMTMEVDTTNMPANITFKNSPENTRYIEYEKFLIGYGKKQQALLDELKTAKTAADTQATRDKATKAGRELIAYRNDYVKKYPNTFLSNVFNAVSVPDIPEGRHLIAGTNTVDSEFNYRYYKQHYWDRFDFRDQRLMYTPIYDAKLDEYFNRLVLPIPDSMNAEADAILARTRKSPELFKYALHWLAGNAERSKVMGMDEVFVHLVEQYYMKGDAWWLDTATLAKYEDRARKIAPNVVGNPAPALNLQDIATLSEKPLSQVESKYTMLVFWSKDCGHCMKEVPQLDSVYKAVLKNKGVKVYAISTEGDLSDIRKSVEKLGIGEWTNVVDANNNSGYRANYDVYTTPKVYLLDKDKVIVGKGLDHSNVAEVIEFVEKKKMKKK